MSEDDERRLNIHYTPEVMAGHYANFANVSHSDYEFTLTFMRVDHEGDEPEVSGVVVTRVNIAPRFMRELLDAMEDNYSKWEARERIRNLPETASESFEGSLPSDLESSEEPDEPDEPDEPEDPVGPVGPVGPEV